MTNMKTEVKGSMLTITIDLSKEIGPSKSGKTTLIASSGGNIAIAGAKGEQFKLGVNCYK